jgi:AP-2 complex subunit alpha
LVAFPFPSSQIGVNIAEKAGMSGYEQFLALDQHFALATPKTQAILLTAYVKIVNLYSDTKDEVAKVFAKYSTSSVLELQQRACEVSEVAYSPGRLALPCLALPCLA